MSTDQPSTNSFYAVMTVLLSGLAGILIGVPAMAYLTSSASPFADYGVYVLPFFGLAGLRTGYLRRHDKAFFYISFFAVLVLLSLIGFSFVEPEA